MTLDEAIDIFRVTENETTYADAIILKYLRELKHRRETEIRPATRFLENSLPAQWRQIEQESKEAHDALVTYQKLHCWSNVWGEVEKSRDYAVEELVDLQTACETMLLILGYDDQARAEIRRKVIEKNAARGYYQDGR